MGTQRPQFEIPLDLLKDYMTSVRFLPHDLQPNGYIIFDKEMLASILRSDDAKARNALAKQIDKLGAAGAQLCIMEDMKAIR